ncbi:IclR family transcriptional regulator [Nocardioides albertanoniae]|uniref:Glycerol operon regulatory protein n=1 Tax=Nocardioides albertanoniae TaxID=1175486 RepID=A0A543A617_9ACTN|nr:IclR family transcriptional regulator [Nocardioides albertanoniae]TQL68024.1 IclR family transcriptional regulator [Nocardioides albertanoniae]
MAVVPAAEQTLAILRYLAAQASPVTAAAISRELGLPRSTTYHLLSTLLASSFVVHYPEQKVYGLGVTAYELGTGYTRQAPLQRLARRLVADLRDRSGNGVHLSVLQGREVVYLLEERAPGRPLLITDVGVRLPAHRTASGRAMLAALPATQVRALYPDADAFEPGAGPGSLSALRRLLADVRRHGFASEHGEVTAGLTSVAMPVLDHNTHPVAAVTVTFPEGEGTDAYLERMVSEVGAAVRELGRRIGAGIQGI